MAASELGSVVAVVAGSLAVICAVVRGVRPRRRPVAVPGPLVAAALVRRQQELPEPRLLPYANKPLPPGMIHVADPAMAAVSQAARLSGRRDPFAAAQPEIEAELAAIRASVERDLPRVESIRKRSA